MRSLSDTQEGHQDSCNGGGVAVKEWERYLEEYAYYTFTLLGQGVGFAHVSVLSIQRRQPPHPGRDPHVKGGSRLSSRAAKVVLYCRIANRQQ